MDTVSESNDEVSEFKDDVCEPKAEASASKGEVIEPKECLKVQLAFCSSVGSILFISLGGFAIPVPRR